MNLFVRVGEGTVLLAIVIYIDGSFVKNKIPVKPIYITLRNLDSSVSGKAMAWRVLGMLQWLPTKLAERIANKMQDELGFPDKADPRRGSTPAELNSILQNHVVRDRNGCSLTTFGCVEWESELYRGIMRARCYPWNMPGHRFHKMNPQVCKVVPCCPMYIHIYTGIT